MIALRIIVGIFLVLGAVGADDYAIAANEVARPFIETIGLILVGIVLVAWGMIDFGKKGGFEEK